MHSQTAVGRAVVACQVLLSSEFEDRLNDLVERRHKLIHRWGIEEGFPETPEQFESLRQFASAIGDDAFGISTVLLTTLAKWAAQFPELANERGWTAAIPERFRSLAVEQ